MSVSALSALDPAEPDESALTAAIAGLAAGIAGTQAAEASFVAELACRGGLRPDTAMPAALLPSEEPPF